MLPSTHPAHHRIGKGSSLVTEDLAFQKSDAAFGNNARKVEPLVGLLSMPALCSRSASTSPTSVLTQPGSAELTLIRVSRSLSAK